jgi:hypothetical protein
MKDDTHTPNKLLNISLLYILSGSIDICHLGIEKSNKSIYFMKTEYVKE